MWKPPPPEPMRVYRDPSRRVLAGICVGIADYLGVGPLMVRLAAMLGLLLFTVPTAVAYVTLALVLPRRPARLYATRADEEFWRGMQSDPGGTLQSLRLRFRDMERRIRHMETLVTSEELPLRRGFRDLGA